MSLIVAPICDKRFGAKRRNRIIFLDYEKKLWFTWLTASALVVTRLGKIYQWGGTPKQFVWIVACLFLFSFCKCYKQKVFTVSLFIFLYLSDMFHKLLAICIWIRLYCFSSFDCLAIEKTSHRRKLSSSNRSFDCSPKHSRSRQLRFELLSDLIQICKIKMYTRNWIR